MNRDRGKHKRRPYFEGWYFKHQNGRETIAFIPSYHVDTKGQKTAAIQMITDHGSYVTPPFVETEFSVDRKNVSIQIGNNYFSKEGICLNLQTDGFSVRGRLEYGLITPLHTDIMGPFCLVPGMQCRHGVSSMTHCVYGSLVVNQKELHFHKGTGYIETDRGRSFPKSYLWTQCNWQDKTPCSLMLSIADIPYFRTSFTGCIAAILYGGKQYRLATYCGAKPIQWDGKVAVLQQGKYRLTAELLPSSTNGHALRAPSHGVMSRTIYERPSCAVRYCFSKSDQTIFDLVHPQASYEYV